MTERELKLEAPPNFATLDLAGLGDGVHAGTAVEKRTTAVYWDTPDLRLARWGASLRHRTGDGWTVKLQATMDGDLLVRQEHTFAGSPAHPPAQALDLLRGYVRSAELRPMANLRTRRRAVMLVDGSGREQAEVVDDEVSVLDGRRIALRFRELEVELKSPEVNGLVNDVVDRLRQAGAGPVNPVPKHVRAMGPRSQAPPEVEPPRLHPGSSTSDVVTAAIAGSVARLLRQDAAVRVGVGSDSVHQARVATRRLRSDLKTFAPLLQEGWADGLRDELRWLGGLLGELRDTDILGMRLAESLRSMTAAGGEGRRLQRRLARRRRRARARLLAGMRSTRYVELLDSLVAAAQAPQLAPAAGGPAAEVLPPLARRPWQKLASTVRKLGKHPSDDELHAVRIAAKRSRYATEAVAPVLGKPAERFAEMVTALQTTLGEYNDAVVTTAWLKDAVTDMAASTAFLAGALSEKEKSTARKSSTAWRPTWKKLSRKKARAWMET